MNIPVERWFKSIIIRHSRRKYVSKQIEEDTINRIQAVIEELNSQFDGVRLILVHGDSNKVFKGIIGSYGKIKGALAYVAMIGNTQIDRTLEKIGYVGEGFILEATALELGTCWIAGSFKASKVESDIELKENERVYAITPLGYVEESFSQGEVMMKKMISSHKRKGLDKLCLDEIKEDWPQWIKTAINSARLAPSAMNMQPWRFKIKEDSIILAMDSPRNATKTYKRMDWGIAMLHLELGALHEGVKGTWQYLQAPDVAEFKIN